MTTFSIKLLALVLMLIDHVGMFFFPEQFYLRIIGRVSFPLFAWLIANGTYKTKNIYNYFYRITLFAFVSQLPYLYAMRLLDPYFNGLNIFFTLALGVFAILIINKAQSKIIGLVVTIIVCIAAQLLQADYGAFGVLIIVIFYLFYKDLKKMILIQSIVFLGYSLISIINMDIMGIIQFVGLSALPFIAYYNNTKGRSFKYFFYAAYPLQFVLVYLYYK